MGMAACLGGQVEMACVCKTLDWLVHCGQAQMHMGCVKGSGACIGGWVGGVLVFKIARSFGLRRL